MVLPNARFRAQRRYAAAPIFIAANKADAATASFGIGIPTGAAPGDLMILWAFKAGSTSPWAAPAGWGAVFDAVYGGSRVAAFTRIMQPGDTTVTISAAVTTANHAQLVVCRNAMTVNASGNGWTTTNTQDVTTPSVTTTAPALVFRQAGWTGNQWIAGTTVTVPEGQIIVVDHLPTVRSNDRTMIAYSFQEAPGPTGTVVFDAASGQGPQHRSTIAVA